MSNLLYAGFRRYIRSIVFWLAIVVTGIVSIMGSNHARQMYVDDFYCVIIFIILAIVISWIVGRENDEGIFRNKIIVGYTKGQVYISELIQGIGISLIMFLIFAGIFIAFNSYIFSEADLMVCLGIFADMLFVNICVSAILVTACCLITKRTIAAIVSIMLVFFMMCASYGIQEIVENEEYYTEWDYEEVKVTDEFGTYTTRQAVAGSEHQVKNPDYVSGFSRVMAEMLYNIIPYGHVTEYIHLTSDWFGYEELNSYLEWDMEIEEADKNFELSKEEKKDILVNIAWSVAITVIVCAVGYLCFSRRDLR